MHDTHGVTTQRQEYFDNPDAALNLRRRSHVPKLRAGEMPENNAVATDAKGRRIVDLPDRSLDCDDDFFGKSPEQIAEALDRNAALAEEHANTEQLMRQYPGKPNDGAPHSSSGGRSAKKPKPPPDFTSRPIADLEGPSKFRPHQVGGRVGRIALHGLTGAGTSIGAMLDTLGETLQQGVSWCEIEATLLAMRRAKVA